MWVWLWAAIGGQAVVGQAWGKGQVVAARPAAREQPHGWAAAGGQGR